VTTTLQRPLSIGELAQRVGLRPSAIRYYESEGLLPAPERQGGQRRYDPKIAQRLAVIQVAQQAGFTIREIRDLLTGVGDGAVPPTRWRTMVESKLPELRALIQRAQELERWLEASLECECLNLDECRVLEQAARRHD
jgi:MerR family redox-sensitive transcriptional activator SoxR